MILSRALFALSVALVVAWLGPSPARGATVDDRPNVVFILADDLGIDDLHSYGRDDHATPNLDRLAARGARFTSAYCGLSICSASRAALMTGKSSARLHLTTYLPGRPDAPSQKLLHPKINMFLPNSETTLAERFKALGYATGIFGKWHLNGGPGTKSAPTDQGFDEAFLPPGDSEPSATEGGKNEYAITRRAIDFLERKKDAPFFLYVAHHSPHIRLAAKAELVAKHKDAFNPVYAAMIETLDDTVGLILAAIEREGLERKTIVVFTSDNGGLHVLEGGEVATHNTPFRAGKGYLYEGGLRVPLIVAWPGRIPAAVIDEPTVNMDFTPTLLELCGAPAPTEPELDGASIAERLRGGPPAPPRSFPFHFPHYTNQGSRPAGSLREEDWKLIEHYEDGRLELFDLAADPGEQTDLAAAQPDRARAMQARLAAWRTSVDAQPNTPNPDHDPALAASIYGSFDSSNVPARATAAAMTPLFQPWRKLMNAAVAGASRKDKARD
ncbi:sulfatase [Planctomyces sp. SH-PL62]|uniref:sulfatase n=1 Tax=Planctomyces sp. SH-PL62 TaxID=1636152 RepID=UPI00078CABBC|nr:sulfatase [Planctomyces sp. SH-PL62]AMV40713.1 Arylsulfatase [Planctomyces sp. SH-PL62]